MIKTNLILLYLLCFSVFKTQADASSRCTEWQEQSGITCIFAGQDANLYRRQCENPCGWNHAGASCNNEELCYFENPKNFQSHCSPWHKENGVTCFNPNTENWETRWQRACTRGLKETWCSNDNPNF